MKATGIVRRIDDLGRVVIPKEIRRTLRIREGDPLEIFTDRDGEVILKKYSPIGELSSFSKEYAKSIGTVTSCIVCITDKDQVIATNTSFESKFLDKNISKKLEEAIDDRATVLTTRGKRDFIPILDEDNNDYSNEFIMPIISEGDALGSVILLSNNEFTDTEKKVIEVASNFLGKQMEQ